MDFNLTPEEETFRGEVRRFLVENLPLPEERSPGFILEWWQKIREKRWVGFSWPAEVTGGGGSLMEQFILKEEMFRARAPLLGSDYTGLHWVGPAIIQFGSEAQKQEYIPEILDSKSFWCTGYSEPDVGSDLASLQCKAVREGDTYVVNGQKIWTSFAHVAKRIFLMVRTGLDGESKSKFDGITCLLVPMDTPGIEVRPIRNMAAGMMADMLNEVFFTDVRVPAKYRLGDEGQGWEILCSALQSERSGITEVNRHAAALEDLIELARRSRWGGRQALEDPEIRRRLAQFDATIEAMRLNGMRALT
ncbi:MAG: acyl-CoA dehydrogenase family protein, partial [Proteobacteria bacterium]|nr:acyl-CoA dehydrogenase family protein [Pseudomonadota bacterium]